MWYALAKTLAEKETWKFAEEHILDLVVVNAPFIVGSFQTPFPSSTVFLVLYHVQGKAEGYPNQIIRCVHIDDVVDAHFLVYETPEANGRYICSSLTAYWREIMSFIAQKWPRLPVPTRATGTENTKELIAHNTSCDRIKQLGLTGFKTLEEMFGDTIDDFRDKGLLPLPLNHLRESGCHKNYFILLCKELSHKHTPSMIAIIAINAFTANRC
ncbi:hypothetical protein R1flu_009118 [Riccia fluitans]|uniref:NAD-dependent epimerase/dehydratase domain-containing protein n=1 Tax=Riccia fluitans TaxID=41844 RepID=A0ABD1Z160_9MARC